MNKPTNQFKINSQSVGSDSPCFFIADIAANHDSDLNRAVELIYMAKEAGADAAKFQHFTADKIVSDKGFTSLGSQKSHQSKWKKSVFEVYRDASISLTWTATLRETCDKAGIAFMTSPYSLDMVDHVDPYVPSYKIGSGDITWTEIIEYIAMKGKPYILATGASSMDDVYRAVVAGLKINPQMALLQCNTNYTGSLENMKYVQLNVLKTYRSMFPNMILGLSDHTPGHSTVLGAVALGAKIIEKHFTDDVSRDGPDHAFSMCPRSWNEMVLRTRELEASLGTGIKKIEQNELETAVLQRRSIRAVRDLELDEIIKKDDLTFLRPCPQDALNPYDLDKLIGQTTRRVIKAGEHFKYSDI